MSTNRNLGKVDSPKKIMGRVENVDVPLHLKIQLSVESTEIDRLKVPEVAGLLKAAIIQFCNNEGFIFQSEGKNEEVFEAAANGIEALSGSGVHSIKLISS